MLKDNAGKKATWNFEDPEILRKEREELIAAKKKKEDENRAKKELALKKKSTPPSEWFKVPELHTEKYTKFDEEGIPTHYMKSVD